MARTNMTEQQALWQPGGVKEDSRFHEGNRHLHLAYKEEEECYAVSFFLFSVQKPLTLKLVALGLNMGSNPWLGVSQSKEPHGSPGAGVMEADDCQVMTVFTVQRSFHHWHSTNQLSRSITIIGECAVTPHLVACR